MRIACVRYIKHRFDGVLRRPCEFCGSGSSSNLFFVCFSFSQLEYTSSFSLVRNFRNSSIYYGKSDVQKLVHVQIASQLLITPRFYITRWHQIMSKQLQDTTPRCGTRLWRKKTLRLNITRWHQNMSKQLWDSTSRGDNKLCANNSETPHHEVAPDYEQYHPM